MLVVAVAALCVPPVFAQATGTVKGVCKDMDGKPIVGANVEWVNTDNGRKYNLKTNKKGEYFSLGIEPGKYKVTLTQDGKQLDQVNGFPVGARRGHPRLRFEEVAGRGRPAEGHHSRAVEADAGAASQGCQRDQHGQGPEREAGRCQPGHAGAAISKPPSPPSPKPRKWIPRGTCSGPGWGMPT